jgi:hypothetical protein
MHDGASVGVETELDDRGPLIGAQKFSVTVR